ncbi:hypothetical protein [Geomicrobium sp. JCM 19039]|uniref:hypothetical protein n=1 Tax=Geomicrobium sp. JCM 19039 TaxID=1460636 RepID=UPI0005A74C37|nr:hypothetical protein [Geomicrobium sp. JCM 19039]
MAEIPFSHNHHLPSKEEIMIDDLKENVSLNQLDAFDHIATVYEDMLDGQLDAMEQVAFLFEQQLEAELSNYEVFAELFELIVGGDNGE